MGGLSPLMAMEKLVSHFDKAELLNVREIARPMIF
jgi:hypothetical protein